VIYEGRSGNIRELSSSTQATEPVQNEMLDAAKKKVAEELSKTLPE
jgi:tagatose-1,6-bisphosphate aldolase